MRRRSAARAAPRSSSPWRRARSRSRDADPPAGPPPTTPIKHVVVIFGENQSFDHYFGTYPNAANPPGDPPFTASAGHAGGQRSDAGAADGQPEQRATRARLERSEAGHLRPQPQLRRRAAGVQRRC